MGPKTWSIIVGLSALVFFASIFRRIIRALRVRPSAQRNRHQAARVAKKLHSITEPGARLQYLRKIDPYVFEELVLDAFAQRGLAVRRNKRYSGDGGLDGQVRIHGEWHLIQSKRYSHHIQSAHVQAFANLCQERGQNGVFVHTGRTGHASYGFLNVHILSGDALLHLLSGAPVKVFDAVLFSRLPEPPNGPA